MSKQTFSIPNISCGHCVMSIKNELGELDGIKMVEGDPGAKTVTVEWEAPAPPKDAGPPRRSRQSPPTAD
jgi:copper chaperone CopZ